MTQAQIDRAVSRALGEDVRAIHQRGFSLVDPDNDNFDPECDSQEPQMIDWDDLDGPSMPFLSASKLLTHQKGKHYFQNRNTHF